MDQLITNPAIQSAVIPFCSALIAALLLRMIGSLWASLGFAMAFYLSVYLTLGIEFTPLTSTRKIVLLGLLAIVVGLMIDWLWSQRRAATYVIAALAAAAALWVIWPVVSRTQGNELWIIVAASMFYSSVIVILFERLKQDSARSATGMLAIGIGTGISTLLGASAKLGQMGGAIGAAAGAYVVILFFCKELRLGSSFTLTGALLISLIGIAGVIYAKLPWYVLVILMLIPAILALPFNTRPAWLPKPVAYALAVLPIAGMAIYLTWWIAGAPPI
ncbi:MAG: hypothetical protein GXP08_04255 [Gammaproteobacteria bacterium]|nr:hypothetical protein [Gammaproteobacteria bacterium]